MTEHSSRFLYVINKYHGPRAIRKKHDYTKRTAIYWYDPFKSPFEIRSPEYIYFSIAINPPCHNKLKLQIYFVRNIQAIDHFESIPRNFETEIN